MTIIALIVLGLIAGFLGKLLMPGDDPGGLLVTIVIGIVGAWLGFLVFTVLLGLGDDKLVDFSPGGLISAVLGVIILLGLYRAVAGRGGPASRRV
jgi:uncharacterized membrane protein YeaQ/YmgE (transglycosylase-associated protein family)